MAITEHGTQIVYENPYIIKILATDFLYSSEEE